MKDFLWYTRYLQRYYFNLKNKHHPRSVNFLHIPKTGGTYIGQLDSFGKPVVSPLFYLGHSIISDDDSFAVPTGYSKAKMLPNHVLKGRKTFSVVRNPFDWLVSYVGFSAGWNKAHLNKSHYDGHITKQGFDYAVKHIVERESDTWPSRSFLFFQLFDNHGEFIPDYLLRNERLDIDLKRLCEERKLNYQKGSPQKVGNRKDYRSYYNDELVEIVTKKYSRELNLFGYSFEGETDGMLDFKVEESTKKMLKYNHLDDELLFGTTVL